MPWRIKKRVTYKKNKNKRKQQVARAVDNVERGNAR